MGEGFSQPIRPRDSGASSHPSLEDLKRLYKERLDRILSEQLTVENIDTFADDALEKTTSLVTEVLTEARSNPQLGLEEGERGKEPEDRIFRALELPGVGEILDRIVEIKERIDEIRSFIETKAKHTSKIITPPQPTAGIRESKGGIKFERGKLYPRLLTLLYLLEQDLEVPKEAVAVTEGAVRPEMVRQTPYVRVEINDLNRVVYICDEDGNASYVLDTEKLKEAGVSLGQVDLEDKSEKDQLLRDHPGAGIRVRQHKYWRETILKLLTQDIPEHEEGDLPETGALPELKRKRPEYRGPSLSFWKPATLEQVNEVIKNVGYDPQKLPSSLKMRQDGNLWLELGLRRKFVNLPRARRALGGEIIRLHRGFWQTATPKEIVKEIRNAGKDPSKLPLLLGIDGDSRLKSGLRTRFGNIPEAKKRIADYLKSEEGESKKELDPNGQQ